MKCTVILESILVSLCLFALFRASNPREVDEWENADMLAT